MGREANPRTLTQRTRLGVRKPKFWSRAGTSPEWRSGAFEPGDEVYGFGSGGFADYIAVH